MHKIFFYTLRNINIFYIYNYIFSIFCYVTKLLIKNSKLKQFNLFYDLMQSVTFFENFGLFKGKYTKVSFISSSVPLLSLAFRYIKSPSFGAPCSVYNCSLLKNTLIYFTNFLKALVCTKTENNFQNKLILFQ